MGFETQEYNREVRLNDYEMDNGVAKVLTVGAVNGIHHTSVTAFNEEYSYGPNGVSVIIRPRYRPQEKRPQKVTTIGYTSRSYRAFQRFLNELRNDRFKKGNYNVLSNNCNIFSMTLCDYLCGADLPQYILDPQETASRNPLAVVASTLFGGLIKKKN